MRIATWPRLLRSTKHGIFILLFFIFMLWMLIPSEKEAYMETWCQHVRLEAKIAEKINADSKRYFIAMNFYNNENVLEDYTRELLNVVCMLGAKNVFVSVYEDDSTDHTSEKLNRMRDMLERYEIRNQIRSEKNPSLRGMERRMSRLATIRNLALEPLQTQPTPFDRIIFLNDIIFKAKDIIQLVQSNGGDYDVMCAMDFEGEFYDTLVTRDLQGMPLTSTWYPYFADKETRERVLEGRPVRMLSCWNGVVVMNAAPFLQHALRFRSVLPNVIAHFEHDPSECCLINVDFHRLGYSKIYMDPTVRVYYQYRYYYFQEYIMSVLNRTWLRWFHTPTPISDEARLKLMKVRAEMKRLGIAEDELICVA